MSEQTAIVWFRHDLRLADNPALSTAARSSRHVVPVFIWSPEEEGEWAPGAASRWWLHESLRELDNSLREKGSRLLLRRGPVIETLSQLIAETGATQLYWSSRYEPAARALEDRLTARMASSGIVAHGFHASRLAPPGTIHTSGGGQYQLFTPFSRAFLQQVQPEAPEASPAELPAPRCWPESLPQEALSLLPDHSWYRSLAQHWQPGERAARAALKRFVTHELTRYDTHRDMPAELATSRLSPYLRHGELSARQVWAAAVKALVRSGLSPSEAACHKFCMELQWREFATQQLWLHPQLPDRPRLPAFEALPWRSDRAEFLAWCQGRTGVSMVDAGMRELWQTGWMHNRARMITASFLVKNLLHDWREGERWFWDTLVDAELASNALNWQWVAGTSPDAAPWFRVFNPDTQAGKFDPAGTYRDQYASPASSAQMTPMVDLKASRERALAAYGSVATQRHRAALHPIMYRQPEDTE
jgi:deoxyribodipyrimidine photo-lyase